MRIKRIVAASALGSFLAIPAFAHDITLTGALLSNTVTSEYNQVLVTNSNYNTASTTGIGGELALGYLWKINSGFGLEFDFYYDFINIETKQATLFTLTGGYITNKIDGLWGLRVLPMLNITQNTRLYLDLGFGFYSQTLGANKANSLDTFASTSATANTAGFRYGGGISTMIYDNISIALGYAVIQGSSSVTLTSTTGISSFSATPTIQYFGTFVTWHFGF